MRGFGGAKFKSIVKEHDTEADAIKYINSVVRKKLRGMKNKELEGGPRTNVYRIVNTKSNCEDKAPHLRHALADIYSQCGIPACCSELGCENCFQDLWKWRRMWNWKVLKHWNLFCSSKTNIADLFLFLIHTPGTLHHLLFYFNKLLYAYLTTLVSNSYTQVNLYLSKKLYTNTKENIVDNYVPLTLQLA